MLIKNLYTITTINLIWVISLLGNLPELSSIDPIEFDEESQKLVASNDATFKYNDIRIKADKITYFKDYNLLNASGEINFVSNIHRLLSDDFALDLENGNFSINNIKYGSWPYFISAKNGGGNNAEIKFNEGIFYYGDPHPLSPNLKAQTVSIFNNNNKKSVIFNNALLRIGKFPIFYAPKIKYDLKQNPYLVNASIGNEDHFGLYLKSLFLFPINDWLRVGLNLDYYSKRGLLYGPAMQYGYEDDNSWISGALSTGFIKDKGITGTDINNINIGNKRDFLLAQHKQIHNNSIAITIQTNNLSDSEITRDFKENLYIENLYPLNFFEATYASSNYGISTFANFKVDDFTQSRERQPEISFFLFPKKVLNSSLYHYGNLKFSSVKETEINLSLFQDDRLIEYSIIDANYGVSTTYTLNKWLRLSPKVEYRGFEYSNNKSTDKSLLNIYDDRYDFISFSIDISSQYEAVYPTNNRLWKIKGLRHVFEPILGFSRIKALNSNDLDSNILNKFSQSFLFSMPSTNLLDYRNLDQINEKYLTRISLNNYFQTKRATYGSRNIMELNFIADFYNKYKNKNPNDNISSSNALWIQFKMVPAPWLKFEISSRLKSKSFNLVENYTRLRLKSSLFWELGLRSYFKEGFTDQIGIDFLYKINDRTNLSSILWTDLKNSTIPRFELGIDKLTNTSWKTSYSINYRKDQRRGDDLSFDIGLQLIAY